MEQVITPNPNIPCTPGYCLQYVRQTFGAPAVYATALDDWNANPTKHEDQDWPALWFPIWFTVANEPAGHVALHAPDHSIYSSSSPTSTTPVHHANLAAMQFYWNNGKMLTYLGWTEDIENVKVIGETMLNTDQIKLYITAALHRDATPEDIAAWNGQNPDKLMNEITTDPNWLDQNNTILVAYPAAVQKIAELEAAQPVETPPTSTPVENTTTPVQPPPTEPSATPSPAVIPTSTKSTNIWSEIGLFFKGFIK